MAIKAALAAALLVALLASAAAATTFTTTVTVDEESNPFHGRCSEQMQGREFRACQRFLVQRGGRQQQGSMRECCDQLMEMDREGCGCQAIRHTMWQAQQKQGGAGQQMYEKAQMLPQMCDMREQQCQFPVVFL